MKVISILVALFLVLYQLDKNLSRFYIFNVDELRELAQDSIARHPNNITALLYDLNGSIREKYGEQHVMPFTTDESQWVWSNHGSAMGSFIILHASITEYLIFYGSPLGSEGHSGLHLADDYFTILSGYEKRYLLGELEPTIYRPGETNHLPRGVSSHYALEGWALELAQGWIPSMLPFGFMDTFSSNLDFPNFWRTVVLTAKAMGKQLLVGKF
ncbi:hypothetical protein VTO42DRAFT_1309 [Malbranchea cinnamomea]